ncbi:MAG TPA: tRNA lysidine(34) synthetase TilS [Lachnospiraceae bacterium]|nr:tRNA lysidine(34) synthetase TilS [Lachnospiraceae bacterium]
MNVFEKTERFILKHKMLSKGDRVIVGVSGGADSVCLLLLLWELKEKYSLSITAVHVNHCIRGAEADTDELFVKELCEKLSIEYKSFRFDVTAFSRKNGMTVEEAGRTLRYKAFEEVSQGGKIAVAHTLNDNCETMLMRFFRGTGVKGLCGIPPVRNNIIRPILCLTREETEGVCLKNGCGYRTDSTNLSDDYTRNKIRLRLIPFLESNFNVSIAETMARTSELMRSDEDFLSLAAQQAYKNCEISKGVLDVNKLNRLHPALQKRVIRLGFVEYSADLHDISEKNVSAVLSLLSGGSGKTAQLVHSLRAVREYDTIRLYKEEKAEFVCQNIFPESKTYLESENTYIILTSQTIENYIFKTAFDADRLKFPLTLRTKEPGDKIYLNGIKGHKSLKKLFADMKIPATKRVSLPLLASGNDVLWVYSLKTNDKYKANEETKNTVYLYITEE